MSTPDPGRSRVWLAVLSLLAVPWALEAATWSAPAPPAPRRHVVEIRGFEYRPAALRIAPGDTVVWVNRDVVPHTASATKGDWDSGSIPPEGSWRRVFTAEGPASYLCALHPTMKAELTVR
jgi:plastocyanin